MDTFLGRNLSSPITNAINDMGLEVPTPVQAEALSTLLGKESDFLGLAETGSGKTLAYGIPLVEAADILDTAIRAVILCPTRELVLQVTEVLTQLGRYKGVSTVPLYGGIPYGQQQRRLRMGAQIVVATPGRLIDHLERGNISLEGARTVVLDEADKMLDLGFRADIERILRTTDAAKRSVWFFTATMGPELRELAATFAKTPLGAAMDKEIALPQGITQVAYEARERAKPKLLSRILSVETGFYGLIFCQTKQLASDLTDYLKTRGHKVDSLHSEKDQPTRERIVEKFRRRELAALVCTDIAGRGLDFEELTHVVNYSLPPDAEQYVHRIGRTARAGREGTAISLVAPTEAPLLTRLEALTKSTFNKATFPSLKDAVDKRLASFLTTFLNMKAPRALEALSDEWKVALETLDKTEIAARFLELSMPELFEEKETDVDPFLPATHERPKKAFKKPFAKKSFGNDFERRDSEGRGFERRDFDRGGFGGRGFEKRPFQKRSFDRPFKPRFREEPPSFENAPAPGEGGEESFEKPHFKKPFQKRSFERHSYERRSFEKRPFEQRSFEKRPFEQRSFEKRPFERRHDDRPFPRRSFDDRPRYGGGRNVFGKPVGQGPEGGHEGGVEERSFGGRKRFGGGGKPFGKRPFGKRSFGDRPFGERSFGDRPFGERRGRGPFGQQRPNRPFGKKPFFKGKPFPKHAKGPGVPAPQAPDTPAPSPAAPNKPTAAE